MQIFPIENFMKNRLAFFLFLCAVLPVIGGDGASAEPGIIPRPRSVVIDPEGALFRRDSGSITADESPAAAAAAELFRSELPE